MPQQPASSSSTVTPGIRCSSATVAAVPTSAFWWQWPWKRIVRPASQVSSRSRQPAGVDRLDEQLLDQPDPAGDVAHVRVVGQQVARARRAA